MEGDGQLRKGGDNKKSKKFQLNLAARTTRTNDQARGTDLVVGVVLVDVGVEHDARVRDPNLPSGFCPAQGRGKVGRESAH